MKLSMLVNPFTERNLQLAAQVGVEEIVLPYPGPGLQPQIITSIEALERAMQLAPSPANGICYCLGRSIRPEST